MSDPREALAAQLRRAADRCCQCTDGHHDWVAPYGTDDDVRISRDDARKIADILAAGWTPPTVKPSVEDVARRHSRVSMDGTCICGAVGIGFILGYSEHLIAETLALLPGRTEAEVKAGELREAAIYAPGGPRVSGWLRERADQWEEANRG